jgi:hypothetical protein
MRYLITVVIAALSLNAFGQLTYPYNPDGNEDSLVSVIDLQDLLSNYGLPFTPAEIVYDGVGLSTFLNELQMQLEAIQVQMANVQTSFPLIEEIEIIDCGHILDCELDCPNIYQWSCPTTANSITNCDRPTWVRYEAVSNWFNMVDSCRFHYSYKAPQSQYGTPGSFGTTGLSASGIGTDTLRFTFYSRASNANPSWENLPDIPDDLITEALYVVTPNIYGSTGNRYHLELSVLINGVWYDTNIRPFR